MKRTQTIIIVLVALAIALAVIATVFVVIKPGKKTSQKGGVELRPERKTYVKQVELKFDGITPPIPTTDVSSNLSISPTRSQDDRSVVVTPPGQELLTPTTTLQVTSAVITSASTNTSPTAVITKAASALPKAGFMETTILSIGAAVLILFFALVL
jgi:ABC-type Na+ efflux pump permease subunit